MQLVNNFNSTTSVLQVGSRIIWSFARDGRVFDSSDFEYILISPTEVSSSQRLSPKSTKI